MTTTSSTTTGKYWVTRPDQEIDVTRHMKPTGFASKKPTTIIHALQKTVKNNGKRNAMAAKLVINVRYDFLEYVVWFLESAVDVDT